MERGQIKLGISSLGKLRLFAQPRYARGREHIFKGRRIQAIMVTNFAFKRLAVAGGLAEAAAGKIIQAFKFAAHADRPHLRADVEREHIREAVRLHKELTGSHPLGMYQGKPSMNTLRLVMEEGGFLYSSDNYSDDLPFWVPDLDGKPFLIIPYTLETNDMRFATPQGFNTGDQFFTYLKDAFDVLYAEGDPNGADRPLATSTPRAISGIANAAL